MTYDEALLSLSGKNVLIAAFFRGTETASEAGNICLNIMGPWCAELCYTRDEKFESITV